MPQHTLHPLQLCHAQLTECLHLAKSQWQLAPHEQFSTPTANGGWSANQCLQHLNQYGRHYLPAIKLAINKAKPSPAPFTNYSSGWLGAWFIKLMTVQPNTPPAKKMKAPKGYNKYTIKPSQQVLEEFMEQTQTLLVLIEQAAKVQLGSARIPTTLSSFITLKLGDTIQFLSAHIYRHCQQAQRALIQAANPQPAVFVA
ncbi:MAG TPA: DinB family protein [Phnomibacter sp.]|nr:DinB family protein [Phnomibacter sp.]